MMLNTALGFGFTFQDLAERDGLVRVDQTFLRRLEQVDAALHVRLLTARAAPDSLSSKDESTLIIDLGHHVDAFVEELFGIGLEISALVAETLDLDPVHTCKRLFVQRQAVKKYPDPSNFDGPALRAALEERFDQHLSEPVFAFFVTSWEKGGDTEALDDALRYAAWATLTPAGRAFHRGGTLFRVPQPSCATASPCCVCPSMTGGIAMVSP
jgi:hypothetical protein